MAGKALRGSDGEVQDPIRSDRARRTAQRPNQPTQGQNHQAADPDASLTLTERVDQLVDGLGFRIRRQTNPVE